MAKSINAPVGIDSGTTNPVSGRTVAIAPPDFRTAAFRIRGIAPLVVNKFSAKAREQMKAKQQAGSQGKKGKAREGKDFDACYEAARHLSIEGWDGIAANSFRKAIIGACRLVDFKMTLAKIAVFIEADGYDADEGTPLVRIISKNGPQKMEALVRNETGVADIRIRPMWQEWGCVLRVRYDASIFMLEDITNLVARAGGQCGVCEGRPSSDSGGCGWGLFEIERAAK
jgi:hypothetical protein